MFKATDLFEHMQRYTREVFAERLRQEGFSSYKGQDIHWYRLVNNEVIQCVYITAWSVTPYTFAEIKYGCHPLFISPIFQKSPIMNGIPDQVQVSTLIPETIPNSTKDGVERFLLAGWQGRAYREPDVLIMCSQEQNYGLDVLEKLLAVLSRTTTPSACYDLHKDIRQRLFNPDYPMSRINSVSLVDEILYWKDEELYPYCREFVKAGARSLEHAKNKGVTIPTVFRQSWESSYVLNQVFEQGNFEEYLHTLQEQAQHNLRLLERNTGIQSGV